MTTANTTTGPNPNANPWDQKELGCMWRRQKQSTKENYLTGILNLKNIPGFPDKDIPIVVFTNKRKQKDTHPDLRIYLSERDSTKTSGAKAPAKAAPAPVAAVPEQENPLL